MRSHLVCALFAAGVVNAQPRVALIDFYGNDKVSTDKLRKTVGIKEGDPLPASKVEAEERLVAIPGVVKAHLEASCCSGSGAILYIGIEERGASAIDLRPEVDGSDIEIPVEIRDAWSAYVAASAEAARSGEVAEDLSRGYALSANERVKETQLRFQILAAGNETVLRKALHEAGEPEDRAMAAAVLSWHPDMVMAVEELQFALRDPDESVRAVGMRGLTAMAVFAPKADPELRLKVWPTWIVETLRSVNWNDRRNAVRALMTISESRDPQLMTLLRERGAEPLAQMALWQHLPHALPPYLLLCRVGGMTDADAQASWTGGERDKVISQILKSAKKK